jgi:hypothetical protein
VAVRVLTPVVASASWQLPAPPASDPVQLWTPSLTVTVPVGVPPSEATRKLTGKAAPSAEGSGESEVIVVEVALARTSTSLEVAWA